MAEIFKDDFESGNLNAWDAASEDADLSAHADAAIHGSYGMKVVVDDTGELVVIDTLPSAKTEYRVRFYFDNATNITIPNNSDMAIFRTLNSSWNACGFLLYIGYSNLAYKLIVNATADGNWNAYADAALSVGAHCVEAHWIAATGAGNNDGVFKVWLDGILIQNKTDVDSDTESISHVKLGCQDIQADTSGTLYYDSFASNDDGSEIGLLYKWNTATISKWNGKLIKKWNGI